MNKTQLEYLKLGECFWSVETANIALRVGKKIKSLQLLGKYNYQIVFLAMKNT